VDPAQTGHLIINPREARTYMSAISSRHQAPRIATRAHTLLVLAYATGAAALAGVGAVHVQQYVTIMHVVAWIGPLFLANAAACFVTVIGVAFRPTRQLAALGGVAISALTLAGLVVSYGQGLLGWHEGGFRTAVALDVVTTVVAAVALTLALTIAAALPRESAPH
jgi:hypothetical protein